jgi:hypothetical protein
MEIPKSLTHYSEMKFNVETSILIEHEIHSILEKRATQKVQNPHTHLINHLFLEEPKGRGIGQIINLLELNGYQRYSHCKMEGSILTN